MRSLLSIWRTIDPTYALNYMTIGKDRIGDPYEVKTYVKYDFYECMLSELVMLRYEI